MPIDPPGGIRVGVRLAFGAGGASASGLSFAGFTLAPVPRAYLDGRSAMVPEDGRHAATTLGLTALGTIGTGMLIRALKPGGERVVNGREILLDGLVGVQLGAGLIGTPEAEAFFSGGVFSLPLQWFNHRKDPDWDFRIGMLSQGLLAAGREAIGGTIVPFQGWRWNEEGGTQLHALELFGNAGTEIALDAAMFGLGNSLAAAVQGKAKDGEVWSWAKRGAIYGGSISAVKNISLGAPVRLDPAVRDEALRLSRESGGPDVSDVMGHTTFRAGGLFGLSSIQGMTLGRDVALTGDRIGSPTLIYHELIHRDQMAGRPGSGPGDRQGHGLASFYGDYLRFSSQLGYTDIPYENEAFYYANRSWFATPLSGDVPLYGDLLGHGLGQLLFSGASLLLRPRAPKPPISPDVAPAGAPPAAKPAVATPAPRDEGDDEGRTGAG